MSKIKDEHIDMLLCFMNGSLEENGAIPDNLDFNFNIDKGEDILAFKEKTKLSDDEIKQILKTSYSRGYIKSSCGEGEIYQLTAEGQGRAISVENSKNYTEKPQSNNILHIGNIYGSPQIGNNNTQNIENTFEYILTEIETSNFSIQEKNEAKSLLQKALAHPITSSIIGAGIGAILNKTMRGI